MPDPLDFPVAVGVLVDPLAELPDSLGVEPLGVEEFDPEPLGVGVGVGVVPIIKREGGEIYLGYYFRRRSFPPQRWDHR